MLPSSERLATNMRDLPVLEENCLPRAAKKNEFIISRKGCRTGGREQEFKFEKKGSCKF